MSRPRYTAVLVWAAICLHSRWCVAADAWEPPDVHEVEKAPDDYLNRPIRLTGRFATAGAGRLRLMDSKIDFKLGDEIKLHANPRYLEVIGRLAREKTGLRFDVGSLLKLEPESARFENRRRRMAAINYDALYDLSRWARVRGQWYQDEALTRLAADAYRQAFQWEEQELARLGETDQLLALADRGERLKIEPAEAARIRHRALAASLRRLPGSDAAAWMKLAEQITKLLPESEVATTTPADLAAAYQRQPLETYSAADAATRRMLHRLLYRQVVTGALAIEGQQAGVDRGALARRAKQLIPEDDELSRRFELLDLERQASHVDELSRPELIQLRDRFVALDHGPRAKDLLTRWLTGRRGKLSATEVEDRVALANDYAELADDAAVAAELYREALGSAESPEAEAGLQRLGYVKILGQWHNRDQLDMARAKQSAEATLKPGDSEQAVLDRLRKPDHVSRLAGSGWISEQWRYEGPPRLWVYLRRSPATGQAVVTQVAAP